MRGEDTVDGFLESLDEFFSGILDRVLDLMQARLFVNVLGVSVVITLSPRAAHPSTVTAIRGPRQPGNAAQTRP